MAACSSWAGDGGWWAGGLNGYEWMHHPFHTPLGPTPRAYMETKPAASAAGGPSELGRALRVLVDAHLDSAAADVGTLHALTAAAQVRRAALAHHQTPTARNLCACQGSWAHCHGANGVALAFAC